MIYYLYIYILHLSYVITLSNFILKVHIVLPNRKSRYILQKQHWLWVLLVSSIWPGLFLIPYLSLRETKSDLKSFAKYLRLTLVSMWNSALREKLFFKSFSLVLRKFSFSQEDWTLGYHSMKLRDFPES